MILYAMWLARGVKPSTVAQYVSMTRTMHRLTVGVDIAGGVPRQRLANSLKGLVDLFPCTRRDRHPITPQNFSFWKAQGGWHAPHNINATVCVATMFCGLLRSCEAVPQSRASWLADRGRLTRASVRFFPSLENPQYCHLAIAPRKQGSKDAYNEENPLVSWFDPAAPVNMCYELQQLFLRDPVPKKDWPRTPLFRDSRHPDPFQPLLYKQLLAAVKALATAASLEPQNYGTHSLRIGGASALLAAGAPENVIQAMGRWSTDIHRLYSRANAPDLYRWSLAMGRAHVDPLELHRQVRSLQLPLEGSPLWGSEYQEVAATLDYG